MNKLQFHQTSNDFISDDSTSDSRWKVLIVDDDSEVHQITSLVLKRFQYNNKNLQILEAFSAREAKEIFEKEDDIAIAFVDVIMETERAGLDLVDFVRNDLNNQDVRIIIRTGQPGTIQEQATINNYDIDDFKEKTELTNKKLIATLTLALKHYETHTKLTAAKVLAEKANASKSLFLANMSHELRTPLHAIMSYSAIALKYINNADGKQIPMDQTQATEDCNLIYNKFFTYFEKINTSGERLLALLNNLLELSELESRKSHINLESFCLYDIVQKVVQEQELIIQEKKVIFKYAIDVTDTRICSDKEKVQQLIYNFISNAIKFSPQGGTISLAINLSTLDTQRAAVNAIRLSVIDEGPGIPEQEVDLIFDKFVQSSKTATGAGGTGLGLSICNEIAILLEGKVWAENMSDKGAKFSVVLPINC